MRQVVLGSSEPLCQVYDVALLDLDGVVYVGGEAVPHAVEALTASVSAGMRLAFVTNNASRSPSTVAAHLSAIGVPAAPEQVVTSAQAAARVVADRVPAGAKILLVGGAGLREALVEQGLEPVLSLEEHPVAVAQGFDPEMSWARLAEGAFAVATGIPWVASNTDTTVPTPRGRAPGNGTLVAALQATTGRTPVVAGKPQPPMHREAMIRSQARRPLVVGDRLDTDVQGANAAGVDSLLVLTGVTDPASVVRATESERPTYLAAHLGGLLVPHRRPRPAQDGPGLLCGDWRVRQDAGEVVVEAARAATRPDRLDALRAICAAVWAAGDAGAAVPSPAALGTALATAGWDAR